MDWGAIKAAVERRDGAEAQFQLGTSVDAARLALAGKAIVDAHARFRDAEAAIEAFKANPGYNWVSLQQERDAAMWEHAMAIVAWDRIERGEA